MHSIGVRADINARSAERARTGSSDASVPPTRSTRGSPGPSTSSRGSSPPCAARRSPRTSSGRAPSSSGCPGGGGRVPRPSRRQRLRRAQTLCAEVMESFRWMARTSRALPPFVSIGHTSVIVKSSRAFSGCGYLYLQPHFSYLLEPTWKIPAPRQQRNGRSFTLDIEHYMKVDLNRMVMDAGDDPYGLMASFFASEYERKIKVLEKRVDLDSARSKASAIRALSEVLTSSDVRTVTMLLRSRGLLRPARHMTQQSSGVHRRSPSRPTARWSPRGHP